MNAYVTNAEYQYNLEQAVISYQQKLAGGNKDEIELAYKKVTRLYNPMDYHAAWYEQYKYLFDSLDDFVSDYLRVFVTVLKGWKPRGQRSKSRYEGSGEFKNYFIGSLNHNYINMIKADQAAKRNTTKHCPICNEWVNPISTHLITNHPELLWDHLEDLNIDLATLNNCPLCDNFKIKKSAKDRDQVTDLLRSHFISKHTSLLFSKFNEMYPDISTISPKVSSVHIEDDNDDLDIYDVTESSDSLVNKLLLMDLSPIQKKIIEQILNGDLNPIYKPEKHKCTQEEWDDAFHYLKEAISIYGYE